MFFWPVVSSAFYFLRLSDFYPAFFRSLRRKSRRSLPFIGRIPTPLHIYGVLKADSLDEVFNADIIGCPKKNVSLCHNSSFWDTIDTDVNLECFMNFGVKQKVDHLVQ